MTEKVFSQAEALDWMFHSLRLIHARVKVLRDGNHPDVVAGTHRADDVAVIARLRGELRVVQFCWDNRERAAYFEGSAAVWWEYITAHARLQIARYAGEIDQDYFSEACAMLRLERDAADRTQVGVAWLPEGFFA
jgi:hypothetical protein